MIIIVGKPEISSKELSILEQTKYKIIGVNRLFVGERPVDYCVFNDDCFSEYYFSNRDKKTKLVTQYTATSYNTSLKYTTNNNNYCRHVFLYNKQSDLIHRPLGLFFNTDSMTTAIYYAMDELSKKSALLVLSNRRGDPRDQDKLKSIIDELNKGIALYKYKKDSNFNIPLKLLQGLDK
jgi:hypothetical protein